ncbi:MAG TPA: type II toxin-antitoxin system VapC family toxin [Allosphingosinicella sp.]
MNGYLLDTNVVSDLVRHPQGRVADRIAEIGEASVATSIIVAAELRFGAEKKGSPKLSAQIEAILGALSILPLEPPVDREYGRLRWALERNGRPIGANDMLIAAQALALDRTLVSDNQREFVRVKGLQLANWLD